MKDKEELVKTFLKTFVEIDKVYDYKVDKKLS